MAPATADVIGRLAHGRADDLLTTTIVASTSPTLIVPAMHPKMWLNPATQENVATLRTRGFFVMEPEIGRLTGADSGIGRFPETATILAMVREIAHTTPRLLGKKVVVSAGGTREAIDPVRFIGNHSSGRQGLAIAYEALKAGADVTVVVGVTDPFELPGATVIHVASAREMQEELTREFSDADALVMAAAVADFRVAEESSAKIKKNDISQLTLIRNDDIVASLGSIKKPDQVVVAFAAETSSDLVSLAEEKLRSKKADFIFANDVSHGAIFGEERTTGFLIGMDSAPKALDNVTKFDVAREIVNAIAERLERHG